MAKTKIELDPPDYVPTPRKRNSGFIGLLFQTKKTLFEFIPCKDLNYVEDETIFYKISSFLIDLFSNTKDSYAFFSLCQHVARAHVEWHVFVNAVKADVDVVNIVRISTMEELENAYTVHLPQLR